MNTATNAKYKILVVDDDFELNSSFRLLLEFDGHEVQTAFTGEAALEKLAKSHYDLLISEYWLPRMRGDQLAALAKQRWPTLPIIMATANSADIPVHNNPAIADVNCLLDKPFTMDQLRNAMGWVLTDHQAIRADEFELGLGHGVSQSAPGTLSRDQAVKTTINHGPVAPAPARRVNTDGHGWK